MIRPRSAHVHTPRYASHSSHSSHTHPHHASHSTHSSHSQLHSASEWVLAMAPSSDWSLASPAARACSALSPQRLVSPAPCLPSAVRPPDRPPHEYQDCVSGRVLPHSLESF